MDNLPVDLTRFVGRESEVATVRSLLTSSRLVTLTGVGGVGKSRLALRVVRHLRKAFTDGVWLVELAELGEPDLLGTTTLGVLGIRDDAGDPMAELVEHLRDKQLLLLLDNCEHLVESCANFVTVLLSACPEVRVLTTSREPLNVSGETLFTVPPLTVPTPGQVEAGVGTDAEAVVLFGERAGGAVPEFTMGHGNEETVTRLCQRLDGVPLAIELAAARLRTLPLEEVVRRLEDRFELLTTGTRATLQRHQTLRAAVGWSFDLCTEQERVLWARLSVFAGSFDLAAAERVCSGDGLARADVMEVLTGLVEKSVVTVGVSRYWQLETLRRYGWERLCERGEQAELRRRFRDYYLDFALRIEADWFGPKGVAVLTQAHAEHANVRAALDYCLTEPGEVRVGLRMAGALWLFWLACGTQREGRYWLDRLLARDTEPGSERATALWVNANLATLTGDAAMAHDWAGEARQLAQQTDDQYTVAKAIRVTALAELCQNEASRGLARSEEAVRLERALGQDRFVAFALYTVSLAACACGDIERSITAVDECLALCEAHDAYWLLSRCRNHLALVQWVEGRNPQAVESAQEALRCMSMLHDFLGVGFSIEILAWASLSEGDAVRAARLFGAGSQLWKPLGSYLFGAIFLRRRHAACRRQARRMLGERAFQEAFDGGTRLSLQQVVAYALREEGSTEPRTGPEPAGLRMLTRREQQVAELLAQGMSNKQIAHNLIIAQRTAESHVESILTKLGFSSRAQVATWFIEQVSKNTGENVTRHRQPRQPRQNTRRPR